MKKIFSQKNRLSPILLGLIILGLIVPGGSLGAIGEGIASNIVTWAANTLLMIVGAITYLAGIILNYVVKLSIIDMNKYVEYAGIDIAWSVIRDVANMGFIFILLYAAINTILGLSKGSNKRLIVNVVLAAVLMNFSLFFTKLIIDAANLVALLFYEQLVPAEALVPGTGVFSNSGLASTIMDTISIQSIWVGDTGQGITEIQIVLVGILGSIVALIAAFVFFAIAILFIIRFVALLITMVLSPLAFLAIALPMAGKYRKQWWDTLSGQAFFAPIYFLMTWVVISLAQSLQTNSSVNPEGWAQALGGVTTSREVDGVTTLVTTADPSTIGIIVNFGIIMALLIASLIVAKEWANKASYGISGLTKWATGVAGGATLGATAWTTRNTLGRGMQAIGESETLKNARAKMIARGGILGATGGAGIRLTQAVAKKGGASSFDLRGSPLGDTIDAGKAAKGGYVAEREARVKREEEYAKSQEPSEKAKAKIKEARAELISEEAKIREEAENTAKKDIPNPPSREKLEEQISRAINLSQNQTISEAGRARAATRAAQLNSRLASMDRDINERRARRVTEIVSASNIEEKRKRAEEKADKILGVDKKERELREQKLNAEQARAIGDNPLIERQNKLSKEIAELVKQVENATGSLKDQLEKELDVRKQELETVKQKADVEREKIDQEFKERREFIKEVKSLGEQRRAAQADSVEKSLWAKGLGYNYVAAAKIRKERKSVKEQLDDLLKETGEKSSDDKKDSGSDAGDGKDKKKEGTEL